MLWSLREPHGLECLRTTAIKLFTEQLNEELTLDFLAQVNSSSFPSIDHLRLIKNNFAIDREEFFGRIVDPKKILQKLNKLNDLSKKKLFGLQKSPFGEFYEIIRLPNEEIPNIYKMLFEEYTQSTKTIEVISDFMQNIELLHIFKDANTRMVYLLLNKELMRNNFDPVILDEPNCFDYMNVEELSTEIKKGKIIRTCLL